ncbi:hypothetical protein [Ideonella sp. BN130291]|uniref:hypothetical protein n=1 Tax=Ideonella sp. BN130291 TaxID=3112940 RepID=UPI002E267EA1|nr:hypothetical protein [Ideonella sp. BN130291]
MVEKIFAAGVLVACLVALLRMALPNRLQHRLDARLRRAWAGCLRLVDRLRRRRAPPPDPARVAEEAIRRAREGHWEGNVYKPRSFRRPKKPH